MVSPITSTTTCPMDRCTWRKSNTGYTIMEWWMEMATTGKWPRVSAIYGPAVTPMQCSPPTPICTMLTYNRTIHIIDNTISSSPIHIWPWKIHPTPNEPVDTQGNGDIVIPSNGVTNVYMLDELGKPIITHTSNPFLTIPSLQGLKGEQVCFLVVVDNRTMINAIDTAAL